MPVVCALFFLLSSLCECGLSVSPVCSDRQRRLFVSGNNKNPRDTLQVYDVETEEWTLAASISELTYRLYGHACGFSVTTGTLHTFGGLDASGQSDAIYSWHSGNDTWTSDPALTLSEVKGAMAAVVLAFREMEWCYVIGGWTLPGLAVATVEIFDPISLSIWTSPHSLNQARNHFPSAMVSVNGSLTLFHAFVFGGWNESKLLDSIERTELIRFESETEC